MKRLALAAIAAATFAAPLAISTPAAADDHRGRYERGWDRDDRDWDDRDARRHDRWDDRRYNGYYREGHWYYGPPPRHWRDEVRYDYRRWRRGDRLPRYYRDRYYVVDYHDYHYLRPPPRGYHYVRDDRGDILLAAIATGLIVSVILNN